MKFRKFVGEILLAGPPYELELSLSNSAFYSVETYVHSLGILLTNGRIDDARGG